MSENESVHAGRDEVLVSSSAGVMTIRLNRPRQRNAVNAAMSQTIADALIELDESDELRVAIITGAGGHFCSGMDLKAFLEGQRPEAEGRGFAGLTERPPAKPLIAAVEGYALAGGFEIVLACDLVVAGEGSQFGLPEVKRGLLAGSGGLLRLPQRLPVPIAMEFGLIGDNISAETAERWGLINRLTPTGGAEAVALELARAIARNGPAAVRGAKSVLTEAQDWDPASRWTRQRQILESILDSDEAREGALAFAEKRPPSWVDAIQ